VTPKPGPVGQRTMPFSHLSDDDIAGPDRPSRLSVALFCTW
jgi:hypothetical protein